jgi:hypothetical protein
MAVAVHPITALADFPRTPSLTSSDDTSGSSDFDLPLKKLPSLPLDDKVLVRPQRVSYAESRRSRTLSTLFPIPSRLRQSLTIALKLPQVLANLLDHLPWVYFYTLTCTCRDFRHILRDPDLKDVILAHYVPPYKLSIDTRDMQRFKDVPTTITHLDLLCESRSSSSSVTADLISSNIATSSTSPIPRPCIGMRKGFVTQLRARRNDRETQIPHTSPFAICPTSSITRPQFIRTRFSRARGLRIEICLLQTKLTRAHISRTIIAV